MIYESDLARKALMFNDVYNNPQIKELYDLAFDKDSSPEERNAFRTALFKQDLRALLRTEGVVVEPVIL